MHLLLYWPLLSVLLSAAPAAREPEWVTTFRYCDLVVAGEVLSVSTDIRPSSEMLPRLRTNRPGDLTSVATIRLKVDEVFFGQVDGGVLEFVVYVSFSGFKNDYEPGQHIVVGLVWDPDVLGGLYRLYSDRGRFVLGTSGWESRRGEVVLTELREVKNALAVFAPAGLASEADAIVEGNVHDVRYDDIRTDGGHSARIMSIKIDSVQTIAGDSVAAEVTIRQITSGDYWPSWRDSAPLRHEIQVGDRYCFLLKKLNDGYVLVRGINSAWEIREGQLYFAGRTPASISINELRASMESSK